MSAIDWSDATKLEFTEEGRKQFGPKAKIEDAHYFVSATRDSYTVIVQIDKVLRYFTQNGHSMASVYPAIRNKPRTVMVDGWANIYPSGRIHFWHTKTEALEMESVCHGAVTVHVTGEFPIEEDGQ